jgi:hypothetical protein
MAVDYFSSDSDHHMHWKSSETEMKTLSDKENP